MSLSRFRSPVVRAELDETVHAAAQRMRERRVGCLLVVREGRPIGLLTDRDIALRVVGEGLDPRTTRVKDVVTFDPITIGEGDGIETAIAAMRAHGVRRLPIVDARGEVIGIVTADDIVLLVGSELSGLGGMLEESADACDSR